MNFKKVVIKVKLKLYIMILHYSVCKAKSPNNETLLIYHNNEIAYKNLFPWLLIKKEQYDIYHRAGP